MYVMAWVCSALVYAIVAVAAVIGITTTVVKHNNQTIVSAITEFTATPTATATPN